MQVNRRHLLKLGAFGLASATTLGMLGAVVWKPQRIVQAAPSSLPDIQFNIGDFIAPAQTIDGVLVRFGPVFTLFATAKLRRTPTRDDQQILADALNTIEAHYAFSPNGVFTFVSYGLPYFNRLPSDLVANHMPRLLVDNSRFALEEAIPSPTDVSPQNPGVTKKPTMCL